MLRKTIFVLATAAALTGAPTADAVALATAHSGWDGLGDGAHIARKHFGGPGGAFSRGFAGEHTPSARGHFGRDHFHRGRRFHRGFGFGGGYDDWCYEYPYYKPNCYLYGY